MSFPLIPFIVFNVFVIAMLMLDLCVFNRKAHEVKIKEALLWSAFWIGLALVFNLVIYYWHGPKSAFEFLAGYLIEKSLSVDNLFVFLVVFSYFKVPAIYQHRVLFWGILGAIVMRGIFIFAGIALLNAFHWLIYVFGIFLVITGYKLAFQKDKEIHPEKNPVLKLARRLIPVTSDYVEGKFFLKRDGILMATPLFVVLLIVETTDVVFAIDSVPAIFAITLDPFIVYTSNILAILGLRALFFALAGMMNLFHYLNYGLSVILVFVGVKMLIAGYYKIPIGIALGFVAAVLVISVIVSIMFPKPEESKPL